MKFFLIFLFYFLFLVFSSDFAINMVQKENARKLNEREKKQKETLIKANREAEDQEKRLVQEKYDQYGYFYNIIQYALNHIDNELDQMNKQHNLETDSQNKQNQLTFINELRILRKDIQFKAGLIKEYNSLAEADMEALDLENAFFQRFPQIIASFNSYSTSNKVFNDSDDITNIDNELKNLEEKNMELERKRS